MPRVRQMKTMKKCVVVRGPWFHQGENAWVLDRDCASEYDERTAKRLAEHRGWGAEVRPKATYPS
jgi:hypothetical protein